MRRPAEYSSVFSDADIFGQERDPLLNGRSLDAGVMPDFGCGEQLAGTGGQHSVECVVPLSAPVPDFSPSTIRTVFPSAVKGQSEPADTLLFEHHS